MGNRDVRLEGARQVFQLLDDARHAVDEESAQLQVLEGIRRILCARVATSGLVSGLDRGAFEISSSQCVGLTGAEIATFFAPYASRGVQGDPLLNRVLALSRTSGVRVHRRRDLVSNQDWHADAAVATVRSPMHLGDTIHAYLPCGGGSVVGMQIVRDGADGAFDEQDRNLVELLMLEAGSCLAPRPPLRPRPLTLRERQTLECLLAGDGEKQAAAKLGISVHTLHDYVKRLYRIFNVASRGELLVQLLGTKMTTMLAEPNRSTPPEGVTAGRCGGDRVGYDEPLPHPLIRG